MSALLLGSVSLYVHYWKYIISGIFPESSVGSGAAFGNPAPFSHPSETFLTTRSKHLTPHKHVTQEEQAKADGGFHARLRCRFIPQDGLTPLLCSAKHGRADVCAALLDCGADINACDNAGRYRESGLCFTSRTLEAANWHLYVFVVQDGVDVGLRVQCRVRRGSLDSARS